MDHPRIAKLLQKNFSCEVVRSKSNKDALALLASDHYDLVMVNRIGEFDQKEGMEVIHFMQNEEYLKSTPAMLITNMPDKMEEAVKSGAVQGFGKADIGSDKTVRLLEKFLT